MRRSLVVKVLLGCVLMLFPFSIGLAHHDDDAVADPFELALANDGVASLPVFKGPFPETENMQFLSQIGPDDLGAKPVPGVWAKGMMNDLWG